MACVGCWLSGKVNMINKSMGIGDQQLSDKIMILHNRLKPVVMYVTQWLQTNGNSVRYTTVNTAASTTAQKGS